MGATGLELQALEKPFVFAKVPLRTSALDYSSTRKSKRALTMDNPATTASSLPSPLERLQASLERSVERSGPNSLYSRVLRAEITRYEGVLQSNQRLHHEPWTARKAG